MTTGTTTQSRAFWQLRGQFSEVAKDQRLRRDGYLIVGRFRSPEPDIRAEAAPGAFSALLLTKLIVAGGKSAAEARAGS